MPPNPFLRFFRWFCHPKLRDGIEGDLIEVYNERLTKYGKRKADLKFLRDVLLLFRPGIIRPISISNDLNNFDMFKNYLLVAGRNMLRSKGYAFINVGGLAIGLGVTALIGLWIYDELTMNQYHQHHERIGQVMQHASVNGGVVTYTALPMPTSAAIRSMYGQDFENVAATWTGEQIIASEDKIFTKVGCFAEPSFPDIITLDMLSGSRSVLVDPTSMLLSETLAVAFFGSTDPINKEVRLNNSTSLVVKGVYKDLPENSSFSGLTFIAPVKILFDSGAEMDNWYSSSFNIFAQLNENTNFEKASGRIKNILYEHNQDATHPVLFIHPMSRWRLYEYRDGLLVSGRMQFVWLFGLIGAFVLFLACINFMNLSTARSEKRAKEVGIRKAVGSMKNQLVSQFLSESLLVVTLASIIALIITALSLTWFNDLSGKRMVVPWGNPILWAVIAGFIIVISLMAGSYPAFYLSSVRPIRALKGTFKAGRYASVPRKVMVVIQFTVSVVLITGTVIVYNQINFAKDRAVGYSRERLISIPLRTDEVRQTYEAFRAELLSSGTAVGVAESSNPMTAVWSSADNLDWAGKDPNRQTLFGTVSIDPDFGDVVNWKIKEGRNFSRDIVSDKRAFIFNEAAVSEMGLKDPVGEVVKWHGKEWKIIGIVQDMVMTSPFGPPMPTVFMIDNNERWYGVINVKLDPKISTQGALANVGSIFRKYAASTPFEYKFADQEYALKFAAEERIGRLASLFATLAILISCLGLFGLASFMAEQRAKEIGIRKILGASVSNLWGMLSKDFVGLVCLACVLAVPVAWYLMHNWLGNYAYRIEISWTVFAITCLGALTITIVTISYQALKTANLNPVKKLRSND